jgi:hypothetical protein
VNTETAPQRAAKQINSSYDNRLITMALTGFVAIGAWICTGILLLSPARTTLDGGQDYGNCGTVVTFDRAEESRDYSDRWAVACEGVVDLRAREALGLGLATVPVTALWVYLASQQSRLANELKRAEVLESDSAEVEHADADPAESESSR